MKLRFLSSMALAGALLSSCVYYTNPVPEMPYSPYARVAAPLLTPPQVVEHPYDAATEAEGTWHTTPPPAPVPQPYAQGALYTSPSPAAAPIPAPAPQPAPSPAATPAPRPGVTSQPTLKLNPVTPRPAAAPVSSPIPAAKPATPPSVKPASPLPKSAAPATPKAKDPQMITNTGPIPVATPVPGDPTRVYNPLDSKKTIRITDKNGKIYPSGKELKVRGTNFHFYVP